MKKRLQGLVVGIMLGALLTSGVAFGQQISKTAELVYNNIRILIDGEEIVPKDVNGNIVEPFTINGTTYLPVRAIANAFGKEVVWDEATQSVFINAPEIYQNDHRIDLEEEKVTMYAPDGRTIEVLVSEVEAYRNVGWYPTYQEAMNVNQPTYSENNHAGVYRTPTGKRYHLDPDCGGKNSYSTTLQKAKSSGLTPCKKCAQ